MKKLLVALLILPFLAFQCHKDDDDKVWLEGKVVRLSCASFVIQITNNSTIGQNGWKDMLDNNKEYDDVINASNKCQIPESIKAGNLVKFRIVTPGTYNNCYVCFLYDAPPDVKYEIRDIRVKHN
jgi:hypothetical protein